MAPLMMSQIEIGETFLILHGRGTPGMSHLEWRPAADDLNKLPCHCLMVWPGVGQQLTTGAPPQGQHQLLRSPLKLVMEMVQLDERGHGVGGELHGKKMK